MPLKKQCNRPQKEDERSKEHGCPPRLPLIDVQVRFLLVDKIILLNIVRINMGIWDHLDEFPYST
jgi:hypothetical protein